VNPTDLNAALLRARNAALEAGKLLEDYQNRLSGLTIDAKSSSVDLVSEADVEAEKLIAASLRDAVPGAGFIGEESTEQHTESAEYYWVVDPLDGTSNYLAGLPIWCVSIGLCDGDLVPLCGVVHSPLMRRTWTASRGAGAEMNGKPVTVRTTPVGGGSRNAMLATGFPYDAGSSPEDETLPQFVKMQQHFHKIRRLGSAAIDMALVAEGLYDGMWELRLKPWDTAAGVILIREAGGVVSRFDGSEYQPGDVDLVAAGTIEMRDEICRVLAG
jgi:myo-inositol-1(or 4)-monophosphatase